MTSTIQAVGRVLRGGGNPKSVPELTSPGLIFRANCTYLGKHSGRDWYLSPDGLELEVVGARIDPNDPAVATARYFKEPQAGGGYRLQEVKAYVVGAFAARTSVKPKVPRPTAPSRPVDALDAVSVFTGKGTRFTSSFRNRGAEGLRRQAVAARR